MANQAINLGIGTTGADTLYNGAVKINSNFLEIYSTLGNGVNITNSLSSITVTGISTFTNGPILIGDGSLPTGTASQRLQVNGGAYISTNVGIAITNPTAILHIGPGDTTAGTAPLKLSVGTKLTTSEEGTVEFDGTCFYGTANTGDGRGHYPTISSFKLTSNGTGITATATGTNFFGTNSNISLTASGIYDIEFVGYFSKTSATTAIWNLVFNASPTIYNVYYEMTPTSGIVAPPGNAAMLAGQAPAQTLSTYVVTTGSLTTGVNHYVKFKLFVVCSAATTNMKINVYNGTTGTITPLAGSYWTATRLPATNVGTYIA
jgi:hypothetical protein